jgi:HPt (histidine-containing phosphotransfer) domain-containing protein
MSCSLKKSEGENSPLSTLFAGVEGLDTNKGLSHCASKEDAYLNILRQFCREYAAHETAIMQQLAAGDWKMYSIKLHAMKGLFATIGMDSLSEWAGQLEHASRNEDLEKCRNETASICGAIRAFGESLSRMPPMEMRQAESRTYADAAIIKTKLSTLKEACQNGDSDCADAISAELRTLSIGNDGDRALDDLCSLSDSLDYEAAILKIDELLSVMG